MVALMWGLAWASEVPVASRTLAPGTPIHADDLRWVKLPDTHPMVADAAVDPVGYVVVESVLEGEMLRAERLLDVDKPERFAVPGLRALRVPARSPGDPLAPGQRVDLWALYDDAPCVLVSNTWVLGAGKDMQGTPDSWMVLVSVDQALQATSQSVPLAVRPVPPRRPSSPRQGVACSR